MENLKQSYDNIEEDEMNQVLSNHQEEFEFFEKLVPKLRLRRDIDSSFKTEDSKFLRDLDFLVHCISDAIENFIEFNPFLLEKNRKCVKLQFENDQNTNRIVTIAKKEDIVRKFDIYSRYGDKIYGFSKQNIKCGFLTRIQKDFLKKYHLNILDDLDDDSTDIFYIIEDSINGRSLKAINELGQKFSKNLRYKIKKIKQSIQKILDETGYVARPIDKDIFISKDENIFISCFFSKENSENQTPNKLNKTFDLLNSIRTKGDKISMFFEDNYFEKLKSDYRSIVVYFEIEDRKIFKISDFEVLKSEYELNKLMSRDHPEIPYRDPILIELYDEEINFFNDINGKNIIGDICNDDDKRDDDQNFLCLRSQKIYALILYHIDGKTIKKLKERNKFNGNFLEACISNLQSFINAIIESYQSNGVYSDDMNEENILINRNGEFRLIDITQESEKPEGYSFEYILYDLCLMLIKVFNIEEKYSRKLSRLEGGDLSEVENGYRTLFTK